MVTGYMKHLLGYVIWNKVKMLEWIADGILESFTPNQVDLLFVLDNPIDGTDKKLLELVNGKLKDFNFHIKIFNEETFKFPCQNWMMNYALLNKYKSLIAPQDDQKITDKSLIRNIDNLLSQYGENIGVIGLRDGFHFGYADMVSSEWSESDYSKKPRLKIGEYNAKPLLNDGGLIYPYHTILKVGYHDVENYKRFYIEDDYCASAYYNHGLTNIVMGNSLIHDRTISSIASTHYNDNTSFHDLQTFKERWKQ
jgi:hypothetical protein